MPIAEGRANVGRFRLLGIDVRIHASWLVIAILIAWSLAVGAFPQLYGGLSSGAYWLMAGLVVIGLGLSILLHEVAHTLVGRAFGIRVDRITLFLFGGVAELKQEPRSARAELAMAVAGPAFSVVAGVVLALIAGAVQSQGFRGAAGALAYLATLNLVLAAFNMIPAFPLDGGRVLRAAIWLGLRDQARATAIAARIGGWIAIAMIVFGVGAVLTGNAGGLWWVLIGFFLRYAAHVSVTDLQASRFLRGIPIGRVMARPVETVPASATLDWFIENRVYTSRHSVYPVMAGDICIGTLEPDQVLRTPREAWATTTAGQICKPASELMEAPPQADAAQVLADMRSKDLTHLLVVENGTLQGLVTLPDLLKLLQLEMKFERPGRLEPA